MSTPVVHEFEVMIRETHLDVFGHVNNAVYLQLFEEARWDIVASRGYGLEKVMQTQVGPTILEMDLKFRREVRNRETVKIRTWVESHSGKVTRLNQVMLSATGEEACLALFKIGLFDMRARKLIDPTPEWMHAIALTP